MKKINKQSQKNIKNQLNHKTATIKPQTTSHKTLAIFIIIFKGAAEELKSISFNLYFLAYSILYFSEKVAIARGITAAYQKLFNSQKNIRKIIFWLNQNKNIEIADNNIQKDITEKTHLNLDWSIKNCWAKKIGVINNHNKTYPVINPQVSDIIKLHEFNITILFKKSIWKVITKVSQKLKNNRTTIDHNITIFLGVSNKTFKTLIKLAIVSSLISLILISFFIFNGAKKIALLVLIISLTSILFILLNIYFLESSIHPFTEVIFKSFNLEKSNIDSLLSKNLKIINKNINIKINTAKIAHFIVNHNIIQEITIQIKAQVQNEILYLERFSAYLDIEELPNT